MFKFFLSSPVYMYNLDWSIQRVLLPYQTMFPINLTIYGMEVCKEIKILVIELI